MTLFYFLNIYFQLRTFLTVSNRSQISCQFCVILCRRRAAPREAAWLIRLFIFISLTFQGLHLHLCLWKGSVSQFSTSGGAHNVQLIYIKGLQDDLRPVCLKTMILELIINVNNKCLTKWMSNSKASLCWWGWGVPQGHVLAPTYFSTSSDSVFVVSEPIIFRAEYI